MKKKPKIHLVGYGKIGRRYASILDRFKANYQVYDIDPDKKVWKCDLMLLCTPTNIHADYALGCITRGIPFLCEKPLSNDIDVCKIILKRAREARLISHVVCNYKFALDMMTRPFFPLQYNYYNPGMDVYESCAQLIYINPKIKIKTDSPVWELTVKRRGVEQLLPYRKLELSYVEMLHNWLFENGHGLWTLTDGVDMTREMNKRREKDALKTR